MSTSSGNFLCLESSCENTKFVKCKQLIAHLEQVHRLEFHTEEVKLKDFDEFKAWKSSIERDTNCRYVLKNHNPKSSYYNCNRSRTGKGIRNEKTQYKRKLKSKGSCKISSYCTSHITVLKNDAGTFTCLWQKTHYGHEVELEHIRLSEEDKTAIANKLVNGIPPSRILEESTSNVGEKPQRGQLVTSRDISNIKKAYNIDASSGKRRKSESTAIELWIEESPNENENALDNDEPIRIIVIPENNPTLKLSNRVTNTFAKLENVNYEELDDSIVEQINHHLTMIENLISLPNIMNQ